MTTLLAYLVGIGVFFTLIALADEAAEWWSR